MVVWIRRDLNPHPRTAAWAAGARISVALPLSYGPSPLCVEPRRFELRTVSVQARCSPVELRPHVACSTVACCRRRSHHVFATPGGPVVGELCGAVRVSGLALAVVDAVFEGPHKLVCGGCRSAVQVGDQPSGKVRECQAGSVVVVADAVMRHVDPHGAFGGADAAAAGGRVCAGHAFDSRLPGDPPPALARAGEKGVRALCCRP